MLGKKVNQLVGVLFRVRLFLENKKLVGINLMYKQLMGFKKRALREIFPKRHQETISRFQKTLCGSARIISVFC